jgi:DUF4097 and DUF4098 domain-containing protein YvlB
VSRRSLLSAAVLLSLLSVPAFADEWKKAFPLNGVPEIKIDTNDAAVEVRSTDRKDVEIRVLTEGYEIAPGKVRVTDHQNGNRIEVEVRRPSEHVSFGWHSRSVRVEVSAPHEANLDLHTGDGHIRVEDIRGDLRLDTGDGRVEATRVEGKLRVHTGDGRITADGRFDELDLRTNDGRVEAEIRSGSKMMNSWSVRTGDGSIDLRLPTDLAADLDVHTGDGRVTTDLPVTISGELGRSSLRGKLNGGGYFLEVRSGDGSIHLGRT